jgi:hypothetical protein
MEFRNYKPLVAYSLDILGSILGIALFGFLSSYCQPPAVWMLCAGAVLVCLNGRNPKMLLWIVWMMGLNAYLAHAEDRGQQVIWSPYYKITTIEREGSERPICVNDSFHQIMVDMRTELEGRKPFFTRFAEDYHQPYRSIGPREEVLILGAGTGNDVAVALQE